MLEDPNANLFLEGMIPSRDSGPLSDRYNTVNALSPRDRKDIRIAKKKMKIQSSGADGYKWPYYDSYVPGLAMKGLDKKIVRRGIQR